MRFVGTARGFETRLVPAAGYALEVIEVGQLKGVSLATRLQTLLDLPLGVRRCFEILNAFRPDVVVGVGGYASGPGMVAALLQRIPTLAFEPNAVPGLANRLVGKRVNAAAVSFAPACEYFRNAKVTGIPVRKRILCSEAARRWCPHDICWSLVGARERVILNTMMPRIAADLLEAVPGLTILHQSGARHAETTQAAYRDSAELMLGGGKFPRFSTICRGELQAADLVLARSGASTVAELAAAGKPALLVPFPQAADDHQRKNADVMALGGAARMLIQAEMSDEILLTTLVGLLRDGAELERMGANARALARPNAAADIAAMVAELAGHSSPA